MHENELSSELEECSREKQYIDLGEKFGKRMPKVPRVRPGLIVSGSEVVASKETTEEVMRRYPAALGLEMEIYAVYMAALLSLGRKSEFLAIKGVADFGDKEKKDITQKIASELSAVVFRFFMDRES